MDESADEAEDEAADESEEATEPAPPPQPPDVVYGPELPPGVRLENPRSGSYRMQFWRGGEHYQHDSKDVAELVVWRRDEEARLDAAGIPAARKHTAPEHQSKHNGVFWDTKLKKWRGQVQDRLKTAKNGKKRQKTTSYYAYADEDACAAALAVLREAEAREFEAEIAVRVAADPKLVGLKRAPAKAVEATVGTPYWNVDGQTKPKYVPYRVTVSGKIDAKHYTRACELCAQEAKANPVKPGEGRRLCKKHGGGARCVGCDPVDNAEACPSDLSVEEGKRDVYDGRCAKCFCVAFPNDPRAVRARKCIHVRERTVMAFVKKAFPDYNWAFDKTIGMRLRGHLRYRPDARATVADRVLIIEVDEHSHRGYGCAKEREREKSFFDQFKGKDVIMLRFNPDGYVDHNGTKHPSCFTPPSKEIGEVHVHPKQAKQWEHRLEKLAKAIRTAVDPSVPVPPPAEDRLIHVVELFYDDVLATPEEKRLLQAQRKNKAIGKRKRECGEAAASSSSGSAYVVSPPSLPCGQPYFNTHTQSHVNPTLGTP